MTLEECFEKGLLRRVAPAPEKTGASLQSSGKFVKKAEFNRSEYPDVAILMAYDSMLHAARAVLFRDGISEKSHACTVEYMRRKYAGKGLAEEQVNTLDTYRRLRHTAQYGLSAVYSLAEAEEAISCAKDFLSAIKALLKSKDKGRLS